MAYNPKTWGVDEAPTAAKMNQTKDSLNFLFDRFIPDLKNNCVAQTGFGLYIVNFSSIDPNQNSGNGDNGATWTKLWLSGNSMGMQVVIPGTIFSSAPYIVGHTTGSQDQWGIIPVSRWNETASSYKVAFRDSGGAAYPISTVFAYSALLIGPRASNPT